MTTPNDIEKALSDAMFHGTGVMKDGKHVPLNTFYLDPRDAEIARLSERLAKAEAERDAAVAQASTLGPCADEFCSAVGMNGGFCPDHQIEAGERRATAAIVADLREQQALAEPVLRDKWWTLKCFADRYERGDHITEAKPEPTASPMVFVTKAEFERRWPSDNGEPE